MASLARIDGTKIRQARLKAGLTQNQLARAVNTTERNIVRWETSANQPRVSSVMAIAEATGTRVDYFLTPNGDDEDEESDLSRLTLDEFLRMRANQMVREALSKELRA